MKCPSFQIRIKDLEKELLRAKEEAGRHDVILEGNVNGGTFLGEDIEGFYTVDGDVVTIHIVAARGYIVDFGYEGIQKKVKEFFEVG